METGTIYIYLSSTIYITVYKMTTKISDRAVSMSTGNNVIAGRLMAAFGVSYMTTRNWLKHKDSRLTTPDAVRIISEETGLVQEEILEQQESANVQS